MNKKLIEQFATIGKAEIDEQNNDTYATMVEVFKSQPTNYFRQIDFVKVLKRSNPFINHQLHKLVADGVITREGTKKQYFYKCSV